MSCMFRQLGIVALALRALIVAAVKPQSPWTAQYLQDRVDGTIHIPSGDYYFDHHNLDISHAHNLSLVANETVTFWLLGHAGVNVTHSTDVQFRGITIDYDPPPPPQPTFQEKSGITLHLYNCTRVTVQNVTIRAAPFMVVTAFQGGGDHTFRNLNFVPHRNRELVAMRDALHFSDLRTGPTVIDSTIGYTGDDFFNVHSTLLLVLNCKWVKRRQMECLLVNPLVTTDAPRNTVYGTFSTLPFVVPGDIVSFFGWPATDMVMRPLMQGATEVLELENVSRDYGEMAQQTLPAMLEYPSSKSWHQATNQTTTFSAKEVWKVVLHVPVQKEDASILPEVGTNATIDTIASRGAKILNNTFLHSHCNLGRFKSPGGVIQGNTFGQARIPNLELSALPQWLEGPVDVRDILVADNVFQGVSDPVHCGPLCEKPECQYACEQCPPCHKDTAWARNITLRNNSIEWNTNTMSGMGWDNSRR